MTTSVAMTCSPCSPGLDPPEAYLPDATESVPTPLPCILGLRGLTRTCAHRKISASRKRVAFWDCPRWCLFCSWPPLGSCSRNSRARLTVMLILCGGMSALASICSIVGLVLVCLLCKSGVWAVVGMVTNILARCHHSLSSSG